jgi:large subunit ribosomal protein L23
MNLMQVIRRPLLTEKMSILLEKELKHPKYAFVVAKDANKVQIKQAIEKRFNVKVDKVHTMNFAGKLKRYGRYEGYRNHWKKAVVTLKEGEKLEFFENA